MHEMALAESVLQICEEHARLARAEKVVKVWVEIGALSHVEADALVFCFESIVAGTLAEGAELEVERPAGRAWCHACGKDVAVAMLFDACPDCGGVSLQVRDGDQMRVKRMQVC